jgi:hypothetical protein
VREAWFGALPIELISQRREMRDSNPLQPA